MRPKHHTFFIDLAQLVQAENLKAARVGEDRAPPRHKAVQSAQLPHSLNSRPQIKVISIAENDLGAEFFQSLLRNAFDRRDRAHRYKHRRLNLAMRRRQPSEPSFAAGFFDVKRYGHSTGIVNGAKIVNRKS